MTRDGRGIDPLDNACMEDDIFYAISKHPVLRARANRKLIDSAKSCISASDSNLKEKMMSRTEDRQTEDRYGTGEEVKANQT